MPEVRKLSCESLRAAAELGGCQVERSGGVKMLDGEAAEKRVWKGS